AGGTVTLPFLVSSATLQSFSLQLSAYGPWSTSAADFVGVAQSAQTAVSAVARPRQSGASAGSANDFVGDLTDCLGSFLNLHIPCLELNAKIGTIPIWDSAITTLTNQFGSTIAQANNQPFTPKPGMNSADWGKNILDAMGKCAGDVSLGSFQNVKKLLECLGK